MEASLIGIWRELNAGTWKPGPAAVFIVEKPVKRELFAAGFRDRIVHHVLINRLNPYFEKAFIHDSYSCRVGKGTHFGIERVKRFIRQCSANYTREAWVLKLDIQGFFMHISRPLLVELLEGFLSRHYPRPDREALLALCRSLVLNDPLAGCVTKSPPGLWDDLPAGKSLFDVGPDRGLPIGNLSSQIFVAAIERHNAVAHDHRPTRGEVDAFRSSVNSYLGILGHSDSWRFRSGLLRARLSPWWWRRFRPAGGWKRVEVRCARNPAPVARGIGPTAPRSRPWKAPSPG